MPNWCNNTVAFEGEPQAIQQIRQLFKTMAEKQEKENCGQLPDFLENAGYSRYFFQFYESDTDIFNYLTKWSPNIEEVQKIAERYNVHFQLDYEELGCLIYGRAIFTNGILTDIYLEDEDFNKYWYDEKTETYYFQQTKYACEWDILEILLEWKIENHFNNIKNQNNEIIR